MVIMWVAEKEKMMVEQLAEPKDYHWVDSTAVQMDYL